jgi:hypothetical protein
VFEFACPNGDALRRIDVGFSIGTESDQIYSVLYSSFTGKVFHGLPQLGQFRCLVRHLCLAPGSYPIGARVIVAGQDADWPKGGIALLRVEHGDFYGTGHMGFSGKSVFHTSGDWLVTPVTRQKFNPTH